MSNINWSVSKKDDRAIGLIAARFIKEEARAGREPPPDRFDLILVLTACHANGCPLDLEALLTAPPEDFHHDIGGIRRHLHRGTGRLLSKFLPRHAQPSEEEAPSG